MSEKTILVTGHKSPDTDSICSAIAYANLKQQLGYQAKAICAGQANKETAYALNYFGFTHPEICTSFALCVKDVTEEIPALDADADLTAINAWRKEYGMNRIPVVKEGKYVGVITPKYLLDAMTEALAGSNTTVTAGDLAKTTSCQVINPNLKLSEFNRGHHGAFPVVDGDEYIGMIWANVEAPKEKQKVILVDHNEAKQIIDGVEDIEIIENIDHHRIGGLVTENPIFIHYEPVGCTSTIVANFYWQMGQEIPKDIAGLMLSAIISDTVLFRSPTCTAKDKEAAEKLAVIAGVDLETYGMEMLKAGADVSDFSNEELVRTDMKEFSAGDATISIGQISVMDTKDVLARKADIINALEELRASNGYTGSYLMITNILAESTDLVFSGDVEGVVSKAFGKDITDHSVFLEKTMSRKKQIVPPILGAMK